MLRGVVVVLLLLASAGCGEDGLSGRNVLVDDTGLPDTPDGGGWMLVLPADRAGELWRAVGERPDDLGHARFTVDEDTARQVGGSLAEVSDDGEYTLTGSGRTLLCRVPPAGSAYGCAELDLPATGVVVTTFGEGGFAARTE